MKVLIIKEEFEKIIDKNKDELYYINDLET